MNTPAPITAAAPRGSVPFSLFSIEVLPKHCRYLPQTLIGATEYWHKEAANQRTVKVKVAKVATTAEKSKYRYSDFYCFMSLADFTAYVSKDDGEGDRGFSISGSEP